MKNINIVYEEDYEDVDIVQVPDDIADDIDLVVNEFFKWVAIPENHIRFQIENAEGKTVLNIDTEEFLWWLNHIKITDESRAIIIKQHTSVCLEWPVADF